MGSLPRKRDPHWHVIESKIHRFKSSKSGFRVIIIFYPVDLNRLKESICSTKIGPDFGLDRTGFRIWLISWQYYPIDAQITCLGSPPSSSFSKSSCWDSILYLQSITRNMALILKIWELNTSKLVETLTVVQSLAFNNIYWESDPPEPSRV